jgi:Plavaka transposase
MKTLQLSFRTAQQLRGLVELLPSGPEWQCRILSPNVPTKSPVRLFYRDPLKCLEALFNHPLFHDKLDLVPRRVYRTAEHLVRVYTEWITGNAAWEMQVSKALHYYFEC